MRQLIGEGATVLDGDPEALWEGLGEGEWLLLDREGRILWLRRAAFTDGTLLLVRDVTADRERQQELIDARRAAEAANADKSKFLAQMSHELRTPLNAILGFSEVIAVGLFGKVQPETYREYAENIQHAGKHLLSLINDVLDLAKIEAGRMEPRIESTNIASLAEDARILLSDKAAAKGLTLTVSGEFDVAAMADPRMLKQIMINLLSNAVKFTPRGGQVSMTWRRDRADMLELTVKDTGIGMSPEDLQQALQPFGQARKKRDGDEPGTGLGLPIVAHLAKLQGGSFAIESTVGVGTVAVVRIPIDAPAAQAPQQRAG
jgi:signal transduction histidine kinase